MSQPEQTIGFSEQGTEAVQDGEKTAAIRRDPRKITAGDELLATELDGTPIGVLKITHSARVPVASAVDTLQAMGGGHTASCTAELKRELEWRYPLKITDEDLVTIYRFELRETVDPDAETAPRDQPTEAAE